MAGARDIRTGDAEFVSVDDTLIDAARKLRSASNSGERKAGASMTRSR
jgi:hypothetical protein